MSEEISINPSESVLTNLNKLDNESLLKEFPYIKLEYTPDHIKHNMCINDPYASFTYFNLTLSKKLPSIKPIYFEYTAVPLDCGKRGIIFCKRFPLVISTEASIEMKKNILNFYRGFYYLSLYNNFFASTNKKNYTVCKFEIFTKLNTDICISMFYDDHYDSFSRENTINMFFNSVNRKGILVYLRQEDIDDVEEYNVTQL